MNDTAVSDVDEALIPLDVLRERLGLSRFQLHARLRGIERHRYGNADYDTEGRRLAVKWGDIRELFED